MARTKNGKLIGAAASAQRRDDLEEIDFSRHYRAKQLRKKTMETCQAIADRLTREEYLAWWETTPDDNEGYYRAAVDKLSELETAEIIAWLSPSPADYDTTDPLALRQSQILDTSIAANWDTIPEIPL